MHIIARGKQTGKTMELIQMSADTGFYIVCRSCKVACEIFHFAREEGYKIPLPLSYVEFLDRQYYGKGIKGFLIDNAEILLQTMTAVPIHAITLSVGEPSLKESFE